MTKSDLRGIAKRHGYTYQGYWDGMYHFSKRLHPMSKARLKDGYKCLKCSELDIEKSSLEWMLENELTR